MTHLHTQIMSIFNNVPRICINIITIISTTFMSIGISVSMYLNKKISL